MSNSITGEPEKKLEKDLEKKLEKKLEKELEKEPEVKREKGSEEKLEKELEKLIEKRFAQIRLERGWIRLLGWQIRRWFVNGPRAEIAHDWQVVDEFANRALQQLGPDPNVSADKKGNLVSVFAYLKCAQQERDFAQAWTYVNVAAALLPLVVLEEELDACTVQLRAQDERLPDEFRELLDKTIGSGPIKSGWSIVGLLKDPAARHAVVDILVRIGPSASAAVPALQKLQEEKDPELRRLAKEALAKIPHPSASPPGSAPAPASVSDNDSNKYRIHIEQLTRAALWNMVNRRISLKVSLWRSLWRRLALALLAPLVAALLFAVCAPPPSKPSVKSSKTQQEQTVSAPEPETNAPVMQAEQIPPKSGPEQNIQGQNKQEQNEPQLKWWTKWWTVAQSWTVVQFIAIALLGLFGGTLSAFLKAREMVVNIPSYEAIKTHTSLRMLLGAAGALVVYVVGLWLFTEKLQHLIQGNLSVFMSVGVAAGFSERLFIEALEKAALNLHVTGTTKKTAETEEQASNSSGGKKAHGSPAAQP